MEKQKKKLNLGKLIKTTALAATYTLSSMYVGDLTDIERNLFIPTKDYITGVEAAEGFAEYKDVGLVTIVNENNSREVFLSYDKNKGEYRRITPIKDNGYAFPESLSERFDAFLQEKKEELENIKGYDNIEKIKDKISLMVDYYKIRTKQFFEEYFGDE